MTTQRRVTLCWSAVLTVGLGVMAHPLCRADAEHAPAPNAAALVEAIVTYDGPLPAPIPVAEAASVRHPVEVDPQTKGLKEAVVWLEGVPADARSGSSAQQPTVAMDQRNFFFIPHVLNVDAGQEVEFLNSDVANHGVTAASSEPKNCFNVSIALGGSYKHRFAASAHPVAIGCPVHVSMAAWIYVFAHRYHAVTDDQGHFRLPPVPPGRYTLQVRHADGGMRTQIPVDTRAGETVRLRIEFHEADLKTQSGSNRRKDVEGP
jgi:plastocyanin